MTYYRLDFWDNRFLTQMVNQMKNPTIQLKMELIADEFQLFIANFYEKEMKKYKNVYKCIHDVPRCAAMFIGEIGKKA